MKLGTLLSTVAIAVAAVLVTAWIGHYASTQSVNPDQSASGQDDDALQPPEVSPTGPHPKAVVENSEYDFGVMTVGEKRSHVFVVRNEGEAPLVMAKGHITCKCTFGNLSNGHVAPGESAEVELTWEARRGATPMFREMAEIMTNDPENRSIRLVVQGTVDDLIHITPGDEWNLGSVQSGRTAEVGGTVHSTVLDEFQILGIESSSPHLVVEHAPLDPEEMQRRGVKSGYAVRVAFDASQEIAPGRFRETLTINTDVRDNATLTVHVRGSRTGPVQIMAAPGTKWNAHAMALDLGEFRSAEGRKAVLSLFVGGLPEDQEFEFVEIDSDFEPLQIRLERDPDFPASGRQRYWLTFEVPAGSPPAVKLQRGAVKVNVKTNHPETPTLRFRVEMIST